MPFPKKMLPGEQAEPGEPADPAEEALMHIHRTILGRMGEKLAAKMPKHPKPPDLPIAGDSPPKSPAAEHVEKLKAHLARGR